MREIIAQAILMRQRSPGIEKVLFCYMELLWAGDSRGRRGW